MLQKPNLDEVEIIKAIVDNYGINILQIEFLPIGADLNTSAYRATSADERQYFIKLRSGPFEELSVALPKYISGQGIRQIIPPLEALSGKLWGELNGYKMILYPYIHGKNGYEASLSKRHWEEFGGAVRSIHGMKLPGELRCLVPEETFSQKWRVMVGRYLAESAGEEPADGLAIEQHHLLRTYHQEIDFLLERAEILASRLVQEKPEMVLCHADLHAGNLLIGDDDSLYIVDWDTPILAPKERDLMYAGGGQFGNYYSPEQEESMFYAGYGSAAVNDAALAYYRYERIIEDLAVEFEQVFEGRGSEADRRQALVYFKANFLSNGMIAIAKRADRCWDII